MKFRTPLVHGDVTKLLIDLAHDGDARWSRFSEKLSEATRAKVVDRHERPFRSALHQRIAEDLRRHSAVVHVLVHTDPVTDGMVLLETPPNAELAETIASAWRARLVAADVDVRQVRGGEPTATGAALVKKYPAEQYAQIRLSVSQTFFLEGRPWRWETLKKLLLESLAAIAKDLIVTVPESPSTD